MTAVVSLAFFTLNCIALRCISGTFFFVGAVNNPARLPWHLWTRDGRFFVGCVWGVRLNGGDVEDLPRFLRILKQTQRVLQTVLFRIPLKCSVGLVVFLYF